MKREELLKKAEEAYASVKECREMGIIAQTLFDKGEGEFHVYEHADSTSFVTPGESDISISMVDAESRIGLKYIGGEPTDREVAEAVIRILKEEGVEVEG